MKPDIMAYTPSGELLLVVEVKTTKNESAQWATKLRSNLIEHGAVPESPFFLLVLPEHVYLWKNASSKRDVSPTFVSQTKELLNPYLSRFRDDYSQLSESSLELAVRSWLNDVANPTHAKRASMDGDKLLVDSGLATQMRHSALLCGDTL